MKVKTIVPSKEEQPTQKKNKGGRPKGSGGTIKLASTLQIRRLMAIIVTELRQGKLSSNVANAIVNCCKIALDCLREHEAETRIKELEHRLDVLLKKTAQQTGKDFRFYLQEDEEKPAVSWVN
jgi:hypothetical protein